MGEGRPLKYYIDGVEVPGTTTITGAFMSKRRSNILINWGKTQGRDGKDPEETRDSAGRVGSAMHRMVSAVIEGKPAPTQELHNTPNGVPLVAGEASQALKSFGAWQDWYSKQEIRWEVWETPLTSRVARVGGTLDAIGFLSDLRILFDWKSGTVVEPEEVGPQVSCYWKMWEENNPEKKIDMAIVVHCNKRTGYHKDWVIEDPSVGWGQFLRYKESLEALPLLAASFKERNI